MITPSVCSICNKPIPPWRRTVPDRSRLSSRGVLSKTTPTVAQIDTVGSTRPPMTMGYKAKPGDKTGLTIDISARAITHIEKLQDRCSHKVST
jgi:hypothetical protein